jgi:hypothetical protein
MALPNCFAVKKIMKVKEIRVTWSGILHLTPLTLTSIIVGVILGVLLVISVTTLIVGRYIDYLKYQVNSRPFNHLNYRWDQLINAQITQIWGSLCDC